MTILYLITFIGGLLLAVRVMMYGVERPREESPAGERSFRLSPALFVAFTTIFGAAGYTLTRLGMSTAPARFAIAAGLGLIGAVLSAYFVNKWWRVTPEHDVDDIRYVLQGHIARVTKPIRADVDGEVAYELGDQRHVVRARSYDDAALSVGTEVVIERIEDDVAYVEAWMEVEKRL